MEKRKSWRNKIVRIIILVIISVLVYVNVDIKTVEEYNQEHLEDIKDDSETVSLSVNCATINDNYDQLDEKLKKEKYVPADGILLDSTQYVLRKEDTVFDILKRALRANNIQMEYGGSEKNGTQYIKGINYLYEFSCGRLSGWMYKVNGEFPGVGCGQMKLNDGDKIEFVYTCDLGRDVGDEQKEKVEK